MFNGLNFAPTDQRSMLATDFSDYSQGGTELSTSGWTKRAASGAIECGVNASTTSLGGRKVTIGASSVSVKTVTWDAAGSPTDFEILALIQWGSAGPNGGSGLCGRVDSDASEGYNCVQHGTNTATNGCFEVAEFVSGSYSGINQSGTIPTAGTRYWVRWQCSSTTTRAKIWAYGGSEPSSWTASGTDSTRTSGPVGLAVVDSSPDWFCEWFSVAIGSGVTAPGPSG